MDEDILELLYSYLSDGIAGNTTEPYGRFDLNIFRNDLQLFVDTVFFKTQSFN